MYRLKLRRITTHGNWIPEIDGLRFVAIAATLLTHILGETIVRGGQTFSPEAERFAARAIDNGGRGVLLFFAISGFILAQPFLRQHLQHGQPVSLKAFFKRRLTRLEPPYILSLLIYTAATAIFLKKVGVLMMPLLSQVFYVHNFTDLAPINFVAWSLEVEVQFYLLAPLLGCLYLIRPAPLRRLIMAGLIFASTAVQITMPDTRTALNLPGQLQFFLVGFLLADLRATRTKSTTSRWWDLISVILWIAIFLLPRHQAEYILAPMVLFVYLATFNGPVSRQIFRTEWIALTGGMCYSFYLMHMLVISTLFKFTRHLILPSSFATTYIIQATIMCTGIYLVSTAYYVLVERPCMDPQWPHKLWLWLHRSTRSHEASAHSKASMENH